MPSAPAIEAVAATPVQLDSPATGAQEQGSKADEVAVEITSSHLLPLILMPLIILFYIIFFDRHQSQRSTRQSGLLQRTVLCESQRRQSSAEDEDGKVYQGGRVRGCVG